MRTEISKNKDNEGITLIALVITIIVLLVLSGVAIQTLSGDNGIITKAKQSSSANNYSAILERLNLELEHLLVPTATTNYNYTGKVTLREYVNALKEQYENGTPLIKEDESNIDDFNINSGYVNFIIGDYVFQISVNKIENVDENITDEYSKYYVVGTGYLKKQSETGPNIRVNLTSTSNAITASIEYSNIDDKGKFEYYYKLQEEDESKYKLATTQTGVTSNPTTYTFNGLQQNKIYNIKIVTTNSNKVETIMILEKSTGKVAIATGNINFSNATWDATTHTARVTISKGAGVTENIQYQIGNTTGTWQNGEVATGIRHGQTLYARLWDGTNGGETTSIGVADITPPQKATIALSTSSLLQGANFTATVTHTDNESGVNISSCKYVLNTSNSTTLSESSYTSSFSSNGQKLTFTGSTIGTYYLHVLTVDSAGLKTQSVSGAIVVRENVYTWAKYSAVSNNVYSSAHQGGGTNNNSVWKAFSESNGSCSITFCQASSSGVNQSTGCYVATSKVTTTIDDMESRTYYIPFTGNSDYFVHGACSSSAECLLVSGYGRAYNKYQGSGYTCLSSRFAIYKSTKTTTYSKGTTSYGTVTSKNASEYPANGYQSGYWYVKQ